MFHPAVKSKSAMYKFSKAQESIESVWRHARELRATLIDEINDTDDNP